MPNDTGKSRRNFIQKITGAALAASAPQLLNATANEAQQEIRLREYYSANDNINIALIGAGGMGTADAFMVRTIPGVKIVAVCDLFDPRLDAAKKNFGVIFQYRSA